LLLLLLEAKAFTFLFPNSGLHSKAFRFGRPQSQKCRGEKGSPFLNPLLILMADSSASVVVTA
jgi:hypothetical protein